MVRRALDLWLARDGRRVGLFCEEYFLSIAEILNAATDGPPDMAALLAVQADHGVTVAPG